MALAITYEFVHSANRSSAIEGVRKGIRREGGREGGECKIRASRED